MRYLIFKLNEYDNEGNLVKIHDEDKFAQNCDEVMIEINKDYPHFSVGMIAFGLKVFPPEKN